MSYSPWGHRTTVHGVVESWTTEQLTLEVPILIFLWAMLSDPRPSRRFWMMAIVYTEVGVPPVDLPDPCFT